MSKYAISLSVEDGLAGRFNAGPFSSFPHDSFLAELLPCFRVGSTGEPTLAIAEMTSAVNAMPIGAHKRAAVQFLDELGLVKPDSAQQSPIVGTEQSKQSSDVDERLASALEYDLPKVILERLRGGDCYDRLEALLTSEGVRAASVSTLDAIREIDEVLSDSILDRKYGNDEDGLNTIYRELAGWLTLRREAFARSLVPVQAMGQRSGRAAGPGNTVIQAGLTTFFNESSPLSNWHQRPFRHVGIEFSCAEQALMYHKALLFHDYETAERILETSGQREQKALGRQVRGFDDEIWMANREPIMRGILRSKFKEPEMKDFLLATAGTRLVEASPYDKIWGVGLAINDPRIRDPGAWQGSNLLGACLEHVRARYTYMERRDNVQDGVVPAQARQSPPTAGASTRQSSFSFSRPRP
ncbi:Swarming motility protein ybiA [Achromobacter sp. 2789STDY5608633]|uniref:NADAR family protein n=1 Tax=Achromobacter sp. 2789STDY5608633 TaxID=1806501 RepID=UPI0006C553C7|nr:NADAR family protein [Achromobacter sp. 2789STDY5608633]CUJ51422.1 Swarming motility protein ybiA [Achromobacter sp. 2789STDY5608633]